jgi:acetyl-CoA decarbonylase/synthase complex subunit gamma
MSYLVPPGLYAIGSPTPRDPVLVTANYKMSYDLVRRELAGRNLWLLVLETFGINVWCAAGKGTFGTRELEQRIAQVKLEEVVSHRTLILPQLGAPGVSAPEVKKDTGWIVKYGPVRAQDIPAYLDAGSRKDAAMREVHFRLPDRMAVAPVELMQAWPVLAAILLGSALAGLPLSSGYGARFFSFFIPLAGGLLVAVFGFPALLPYLPFKAFALKGAVLGLAWTVASVVVLGASMLFGAGLVLLVTPIVAFIAMNFTGSSTFTSQPGAAMEVRRGILPIAASAVLGIGLSIAARVFTL